MPDARPVLIIGGGGGGGGSVNWGDVGGTLADQTDLQTALDAKADASDLTTHVGDTSNPHAVTKTQVGLSNVTNDAQLKAADLDTDGTLAADSDAKVASQKATKTYADTKTTASAALSAAQGIKLDDFTAPDDNTDLDASTAKHGLMPKADKTKLDAISANAGKKSLIVEIGDGSNVITTGTKGYGRCPWAGTITKATVLETSATPVAGSIVLDVWKDTYAAWPPTNGDSITASAKPTLSTASASEDATLTGWTTSVSAGDTFGFEVESITGCKRVLLLLELTLT